MAKIGRSNVVYAKLPEEYATKAIPEAKLTAALNMVVPKELERYAPKILDELHDELSEHFRRELKKRLKKLDSKKDEF